VLLNERAILLFFIDNFKLTFRACSAELFVCNFKILLICLHPSSLPEAGQDIVLKVGLLLFRAAPRNLFHVADDLRGSLHRSVALLLDKEPKQRTRA